ncbi:MAG: ferritin family protein [Syntrophomonadaceae bacterium]
MLNKELEMLKTAILNEQEGYQFYLMAAEKADNPDVKAVFSGLAAEEAEHERWLRNMYNELLNQETARGDVEEQPFSPHIFTPDKLRNNGGLVVWALHIGIMMEKASMDFYRLAALETSIESLQVLLTKLANWEQGHLDFLEKAYDWARDDWWDKQGFSGS